MPTYDPIALQANIDRIEKTVTTLYAEIQKLEVEKAQLIVLLKEAKSKEKK